MSYLKDVHYTEIKDQYPKHIRQLKSVLFINQNKNAL